MIITTIANKPVARPVCQAWFSVLYRCSLSPLYRGGSLHREVKYLSSCGSQDVTEGSLAQGMPALNPLPPALQPPSPKDTSKRAPCGMLRAVGGAPAPAGQGSRDQTLAWPRWRGRHGVARGFGLWCGYCRGLRTHCGKGGTGECGGCGRGDLRPFPKRFSLCALFTLSSVCTLSPGLSPSSPHLAMTQPDFLEYLARISQQRLSQNFPISQTEPW